jgi:hypothetical protein
MISAVPGPPPTHSSELEQMLTVSEIAQKWCLDPTTVRDLFRNEQGVLVLVNPRSRKRRYATLRIPVSVVSRVQRRLSVSKVA